MLKRKNGKKIKYLWLQDEAFFGEILISDFLLPSLSSFDLWLTDGREPASSLLPPLSDLDGPAFEGPCGLVDEDDSESLWTAEPPVRPK